MAIEPPATIRSQYTERIAADLAANREEQEQLRARLAQLQEDEAWLVKLRQASHLKEPESSSVNEQAAQAEAQAEEPAEEPATPARGGRTLPAARRPQARTRARETGKKAAASATKESRPPLRTLAHEILLRTPDKPRAAAEVFADLEQAHPERNAASQAVRNALESLVASGAATRQRQGRSVYYTAQPVEAAPVDRENSSQG